MDIKRYKFQLGNPDEDEWCVDCIEYESSFDQYETAEWVKYEDVKHLLNVPKAEAVQPPESYPKLSDVRAEIEVRLNNISNAMHNSNPQEIILVGIEVTHISKLLSEHFR